MRDRRNANSRFCAIINRPATTSMDTQWLSLFSQAMRVAL